MKTYNFEQLSEEWYAIRRGIPTASNFDKIITSKGEPSKQRTKYMYRLAGEAVSGIQEETYQNAAMIRGIELEEEARDLYEVLNDTEVEQVGFCLEDAIVKAGASPDGIINDFGMLEIKCPLITTHVDYLLKGKLPTEYFQQVQGQLYITGSDWCDFMSYFPGLKPLIIRVGREEDFINKLEDALVVFCKELNKIIIKIK